MKKNKGDISFLAKVILAFRKIKAGFKKIKLFKRINEKQKSLSHYSDKHSPEEALLSYCFGVAKAISVLAMLILLVLTFCFGSRVISYDKVYYMFKDIGYIKSFGEAVPESLSYSQPVRNQVFSEYKNGLLVASDSEIKFFTSTGRVTMSDGSEFVNPRVSSKGQYALIYDQGRNIFSVYNSFVRLYSERTDYQISYAEMAENGDFLIVTKSKKYNSVVKIYDESFNLKKEYSKNDHVISASLSSNGRYAAILSLSASGGDSVTKLTVLDCKNEEIVSESTFSSSMPYLCRFLSSNRILSVYKDKFCITDIKGDTVHEYEYGSELIKITVNDDSFLLIFNGTGLSGSKTAELFNDEGSRIFKKSIDGNILDVGLSEDHIYILKNRELVRINILMGTSDKCETSFDHARIIIMKDSRLLLCSQTSANYISFDK